MATNNKIKNDIQRLNVGSPLIELFTLDATDIGGSTYYFTPGTIDGSRVTFNSVEYTPLPVEVEGFEWNGEGKLPRPTIRVSNITLVFLAAIATYNDLVGAKLTRIRTYKKYLDGESEADPNAQFPQDIFYIERKLRQNKFMVEWELISSVDLENILIPKGQVLDMCTHRYRTVEGGSFDYTLATCPYTGTNYFDETGTVAASADDMCGKKLYDCKLRYDADSDQLPFRGFPGIGKLGYPYRR